MKKNDCIFCKIINKEIPSQFLFEDDNLIIIKDIKPSAPIHHLIIPKKHIESIATLKKEDGEIINQIFFAAKNQAEKIDLKGYKTVFNVDREGGQIIDHLHLHLLGGWTKKLQN